MQSGPAQRVCASSAEAVNRNAWSARASVFVTEGWTDPGEPVALLRVATDVRNRGILDVGAGGGRTAAFLRLLSDDYVAVDYTPEMVELFSRRHPDAVVHLADARDLSLFANERFGLVVFSYSGIDAIDHEGRHRALREFNRVLEPGGWLLFSTHNKDGRTHGIAPWELRSRYGSTLYRVLRFAAGSPVHLPRYRRMYTNWWRNRRLDEDHGDWAMTADCALDFGLVAHYVRLPAQLADLESLGFCDIEAYGNTSGARVVPPADVFDIDWFHIVARKPPAPPR